jgi:hypothetical protein
MFVKILYSYYDIIFSRLPTIDREITDREITVRCIALLNQADPDRWERGHMENILLASAYMRLIFGPECLYFSDFQTGTQSITECESPAPRNPPIRSARQAQVQFTQKRHSWAER